MTFEHYKGKRAIIRSTSVEGTIENVINKRGANTRLAARYILIDDTGKLHELMPHEIEILEYESE